ncbi:hypothetical protein ACLOJK_032950 [Asimina triloba]
MLVKLRQEEGLLLRIGQQMLVVRWQAIESELVREVKTTLVVCDTECESILGNPDPPLLDPEAKVWRVPSERKEMGRILELSINNILIFFGGDNTAAENWRRKRGSLRANR